VRALMTAASLLLALFLGSTFVTAHAADEARIPPVKLLAHIQLIANPGWFLTINADGSGSIGVGSNVSDFAAVPVGTFDFEKVYSGLSRHARGEGSLTESFGVVTFHQQHATTTSVLYTNDVNLVLGLFDTAQQNAVGMAFGLTAARVRELWERSPPSVDYRGLTAAIAADIADLRESYPQLADFSVARHLQADRYEISYSYHTHDAPKRGGWTSGVPNPDADGIWFHIDFHDPDSRTELHTQPVVAPYCLGNMRVLFLSLEGKQTKSVTGAIWGILQRHGIKECDQGLVQY